MTLIPQSAPCRSRQLRASRDAANAKRTDQTCSDQYDFYNILSSWELFYSREKHSSHIVSCATVVSLYTILDHFDHRLSLT